MFKNEHLGRMPVEARELFKGLWCLADREGRLEDRPFRIKAEIFPYDKVEDEEKWTNELLNMLNKSPGMFILRYQDPSNGISYIQILNFLLHQKPHPHEKKSIIPPPSKDVIKCHYKSLHLTKCSADIIIPSSLNHKELATPGHFKEAIKDENLLTQIIDLGRWLEEKHPGFPWRFIQSNRKFHPQAILEVLEIIKKYIEDGELRKPPWAVGNKLLPIKNKDWNARDVQRAHKQIEQEMKDIDPDIQELAGKLFKGV